MSIVRIPEAPTSIQKGASLKEVLGTRAIDCLAHNISLVYLKFDEAAFRQIALAGLEPLALMARGPHIASALRQCLPSTYSQAIEILLASLTPPLTQTDGNGLAVFFYHPHTSFVAAYGLDASHNEGEDPFQISMQAQYELTQRFSAEFSIRPFLIQHQDRTLATLIKWTSDPSPHVRRLCSEGTRPRLPWGKRIQAFIANPEPTLSILEALKDDDSLYVRRSVANHLGDIAKDHPETVFALCERWLKGASAERKWLIRHAVRHPAKMQNKVALRLRTAAK
ncbi:MAG: DNA alkylation repair protein [Anaerolineae bacterium]|nr:DNA alkylation repair protein [Anaerolineae bacterium]